MFGRQLTVDEFVAAAFGEVLQAQFGRVGRAAEHGFTEEYLTEADAIQTADESISVAAFDRVREPGSMHVDISIDHLLVDPGAGLAVAVIGACLDYLGKVFILADSVTILAGQFFQALALVKIFRVEHGARCR